jgi:hypothetical protein
VAVRISVALQHHPSRAELVAQLLPEFEPLSVDVVSDPQPDGPRATWRTYRRALETTPSTASHRVIIQDDVELCRSFPTVLERAIAARPDRFLVLCVCGDPMPSKMAVLKAHQDGRTFAELNHDRWVPTIALVWPAAMIQPALEFVDAQPWPQAFKADDEIVMRIAVGLKIRPLATVPSLVEHPDRVESVKRKRKAFAGRDRGRVAALFMPDDVDPLELVWA